MQRALCHEEDSRCEAPLAKTATKLQATAAPRVQTYHSIARPETAQKSSMRRESILQIHRTIIRYRVANDDTIARSEHTAHIDIRFMAQDCSALRQVASTFRGASIVHVDSRGMSAIQATERT